MTDEVVRVDIAGLDIEGRKWQGWTMLYRTGQ